jgi:hypothetical protein
MHSKLSISSRISIVVVVVNQGQVCKTGYAQVPHIHHYVVSKALTVLIAMRNGHSKNGRA